jgi:antirestriction protein ArdC
VLEGDRKAIFQAAAHAQRAVAYLHDLQPRAEMDREAA